MTETYIGEIQMFGFDYSPKDWAFCNGVTIPIQQNTALFALLGVQYGGNGTTTFQLPNFAGRAGCEQERTLGQPGRSMGEAFGTNTVTLTSSQIPGHTHSMNYFSPIDSSKRAASPANGYGLAPTTQADSRPFLSPGVTDTSFSPSMLAPSGGNLPHPNQQPYLAINFCIALRGVFPSFS